MQLADRIDELTCRLREKDLFRYLANASFAMSDRPHFKIPLDLNIGTHLYVTVREFYPLQSAPEIRHAYRAIQGADGNKSYGRHRNWSPPIIMLIKDGELSRQIQLMGRAIPELFDHILDDPTRWSDWTMQYFRDREEDFQTTILDLIGQYYRNDIEEHTILKTSLSLLWFEYLLLNKFAVPPGAVPQLEANLESRRPLGAHRDIEVIPDTINRFLKAIILPLATEAARKLTECLHDMLFKMAVTQKLSKARTDLVLCMVFVLMMFLGRTQATLLLLSDSPAEEIGMEYSIEDAENTIENMEESVSEYLLSFHKYTLGRKSSKSSLAGANETNSPCEVHARDFDLVGRLRQAIAEDYGKPPDDAATCHNLRLWADKVAESERPSSLEVGDYNMATFRYMNVRRLCWKVFMNVEHDGSNSN